MATDWERALGRRIWEARTAVDAEQLLEECQNRFGAIRVAVGRENNSGTINVASDSGLALIERLTNGIDSRIELAVGLSRDCIPSSPEEAARLLFQCPGPRASGYDADGTS